MSYPITMSGHAVVMLNTADTLNFYDTLKQISAIFKKDIKDVCNQGMYHAVISASKATRPGDKATSKGLAQKYTFRPIENRKQFNRDGQYYYYYEYKDRTGQRQVFRSPNDIGQVTTKYSKPKQATLGIKYWNKELNQFDYSPHFGSKTDKTEYAGIKRIGRKIPNAGAAKMGWYCSLKQLPGKIIGAVDWSTIGKYRKMLASTQSRFTAEDGFIQVTNLVDYTGTTSPGSANIGIEKATNKMIAIYQKKLDKAGTY